MPKRKPDESADPQEPGNGSAPGAEATAQLTVRGPMSKVRRTLEGDALPAVTEDAAEAVFAKAIRNQKNLVVVKRIQPRAFQGQKVNVEVYREACPLDIRAIEEEIFSTHGGRRYRVAVQDRDGMDVAARVIETDADPVPPVSEVDPFGGMTAGQAEPSPGEQTEAALQQQARVTQAMVQNEQLRQQLDDIRSQRAGGRAGSAADAQLADLARKLAAREENDRFVALQRQHEEGMAEIKEQMKALAQPQKSNDDAMINLFREQMKQSDNRFTTLMEQMRDSKLDGIEKQIAQLVNAPRKEGMGMLEAVRAAREVKELLSDDDGDGGDDEEVTEETAWKHILKEVSKAIPKVFDLFAERAKTEKISKEDMVAEVNRAAASAASDAVARIRAQQVRVLPGPVASQQLPAPVAREPQTLQPPPVVVQEQWFPSPSPTPAAPAGVSSLPPLSATPPASVPGVVEFDHGVTLPPITEPEPENPVVSPEIEAKLRVAKCIEALRHEMKVRPRRWEWTVFFWETLPEEILERAVAAPTPVSMMGTFAEVVRPDAVTLVQNEIAANPKIVAWVQRGLDELKGWVAEAATNPEFDPTADEE